MDDFEKELKIGFLDEASQAISETEQCFLSLESDQNQADNINKIFRLAHNLKGSSKAVGFTQFGEFTHEFESLILKIKNNQLPINKIIVSLLLEGNDFLMQMVGELKGNLEAQFQFSELLEKFKNPPSEVAQASEVKKSESVVTQIEVEKVEEEKFQLPVSEKTVKKATISAEENIRVSVLKLEKLVNFVGEMVILHSVIKEKAAESRSVSLIKTIHELEKVGKEIQEISMGLRLVPIKPVFQKMNRIVRDTASALGKNVDLILHGEETELDKTILDKISDPLTHLVRNAVDHGVESAEKRIQAGKTEKANVYLRAFNRSGRLMIEVQDDGGGLNAEFLVKKAVQKGILKENAQLTDKEAFNLIFAPGFSTKEVVTDVSGRGVGMDVVKTNILDLGGEVNITSNLGKGTMFQISLPLTLAIMDAMTVTYSNQKFVIPLSHVHETVPTKDYVIQKSQLMGDVLLLRGENIKLVRLGDLFGIRSSHHTDHMITMVIRTGPVPFAILVDDILSQGQVVVKAMSPDLMGLIGISGSTILGDGKPALILEPADLLKRKVQNLYTPQNITSEGTKAA